MERVASGAFDDVWAKGNVTIDGKAKGAFAWLPSGNYYNVYGQSQVTADRDAGYIYQTLLTLNFGRIADLTAIGYAINKNNAFEAADVYVSDDGYIWTLVGSYDRPAKRMSAEGADYTYISVADFGEDASGTSSAAVGLFFDLPAGTKGQFVRIAATSAAGHSNPIDPGKYEDYTNDFNTSSAFRELFVFGSLTADLGVPAVTYRGHQQSTAVGETYDLRFVSQIKDVAAFSELGIKLEVSYMDGTTPVTRITEKASATVWKSLYAMGSDQTLDTITPDDGYSYFLALTLEDIPADLGEVTFTVTPFAVLSERGETVYFASEKVVYNHATLVE